MGVGTAIKLVGKLKDFVDSDVQERLEATQRSEGCPHIAVIHGYSGAAADRLSHQKEHGGISWRTIRGTRFFWHAQEDFEPLKYIGDTVLIGKGLKSPRNGIVQGRNCVRCEAAINARRKGKE